VNGNLPADSNILNRWKNYFSQLLNVRVHSASAVMQYAEPLVSGPSRLEAEIAIEKLKNYK
jgi:hypothetical protein